LPSRSRGGTRRWLQGDVAETVAGLKDEGGDDLHLVRSSVLAQTLIKHDPTTEC
jgi:hypothetical protein